VYSSLDVDLQDNDLVAEIVLLADLMVTASEAAEPLDLQTIDEALGLWPAADVLNLPTQRIAG
jgi:hypothetical protein